MPKHASEQAVGPGLGCTGNIRIYGHFCPFSPPEKELLPIPTFSYICSQRTRKHREEEPLQEPADRELILAAQQRDRSFALRRARTVHLPD